jgi:alkylation response protein AidB-like acyl-CoA dehydrogenase
MSAYTPPIDDMQFLLHDVLGFNHADLDRDTTEAILGEAAKLASEVLAPLNDVGDKNGSKLKDGAVTTAPGFKEAYKQYCDGGWNSVPFDPAFGGQGMPWALAFAIQEMWQAANISFGLCPLLNQGAVKAILSHGSDEQKAYYLPKLISGEWTGTMNLTESHAGSDLGWLRTKADPAEGGSYKISGQKIFITYGEHDMAENIIHLVLARIAGAPDDIKGISLFIVPKFLKDGQRNALQCIGIEHKLGIHASPTCTMEFDGATGYLIGEANMGLKYMFTMMNNARLSVGLQGVALAERAYQKALAYAQDRVQGKCFTTGERVVIAEHADVKRMLLSMKSQADAGRALTTEAALALDAANAGDAIAQAKVEIMTPLVKSWCTDMALDVASIGMQIHGGMGFIEETGAAQFYRDARILAIYEGTNGIQALDLVFRKLLRDNGEGVKAYIGYLKSLVQAEHQKNFTPHFEALDEATDKILEAGAAKNMDMAEAMASPYLRGFAIIAGAALLSKSSAALQTADPEFAKTKIKHVNFFIGNHLCLAKGHLVSAMHGSRYI